MERQKSRPDLPGDLFDTSSLFEKPEPLKGVRVLEVCSVVLGRNSARR
jgi:hypothetical protein